jgi:hypothetical protein
MVPPLAGTGPSTTVEQERYAWLTPDRLLRLRGILLGLTLFLGLVVWVFHSLAPVAAREAGFIGKLRGVGILTWLYALVQMIDMKYYRSRFAQRRLSSGLPQSVYGWLFGQMLAWFGILYYGLTQDVRWYVAGLAILLLSFLAFPIPKGKSD